MNKINAGKDQKLIMARDGNGTGIPKSASQIQCEDSENKRDALKTVMSGN